MNLQKSTDKPRGRSKSAAKREQMVEAAGTLFTTEGFGSTSMEAIAKAAEVSKQTLYSHFGSKEELFVAAIESRIDSYQLLASDTDLERPPAIFLAELAEHYCSLLRSDEVQAMYRTLISESASNTETADIAKLFWQTGPARAQARLSSYLAHQHQQRRLFVPEAEIAAKQFFHMLQAEAFLQSLLGLDNSAALDQQSRYNRHCLTMFIAFYDSDKHPPPISDQISS